MATGRRRRSRRQFYENLIIVILLVACLICVVCMLFLSASFQHRSFGPAFSLRHPKASLDSDESTRYEFSKDIWMDLSSTQFHEGENFIQSITSFGNDSEAMEEEGGWITQTDQKESEIISRVAFGSCTSRRAISQPIWRHGIIPSRPQAWIWAGDIAYMDWPEINCKENPTHHQCNCTRDWLHHNRQTCLAGDIPHAVRKLKIQLQNLDYKEFVDYMCPSGNSQAPERGDLALCRRPILGTWDDHDYNWQDGDRRLPTKEGQKNLFLDAFGVPPESPRRNKERGIYWKHTLNEGITGKEIDVLLLDERFHRDNKPCQMRREFCEKVALPDPRKYKHSWCKDFLQGGAQGTGSCCWKDEQISGGSSAKISRAWIKCLITILLALCEVRFDSIPRRLHNMQSLSAGWCKMNNQPGDEFWEAVCNPRSKAYGSPDLAVDLKSGDPVRKDMAKNMSYDDGILCEVLGPKQRAWLQEELYQSRAPLKLIVSGSPVFNNPKEFICGKALKWRPAVNCTCFDDYDCYRPAQLNLLHSIGHAPGCVVVLTGDFHFSDIKALHPGKQTYSDAYDSFDLPHSIFQIMASGLTPDTAQPAQCDGYHVDKAGMRPQGECGFVSEPAFGIIEVDWDAPERIVKLQIRDEQGEVKLESRLKLDTCTPSLD